MSVFINFVCDHPGCKTLQGAKFERSTETWDDMLIAMSEQGGWSLVLAGDNATVLRCFCKEHASDSYKGES